MSLGASQSSPQTYPRQAQRCRGRTTSTANVKGPILLSPSRNLLTDCGVAERATALARARKLFWSLSGDEHMIQSLFEKRATNREYQRSVDDCLTVLFCGFPEVLLASLRQRVGSSGLVRRGQAEGTDARACSMQVAVLLIRKIVGSLSKQDRQDVAQAFLQNDDSNPTYKGFKYMLQVAEQFNVSSALVSYLNAEVAGQLGGMSQGAIFNSWIEGRIDSAIGQLRARCLEEAERKSGIW